MLYPPTLVLTVYLRGPFHPGISCPMRLNCWFTVQDSCTFLYLATAQEILQESEIEIEIVYLHNEACDQPETRTRVRSMAELINHTSISIYRKNSIRRVFPNPVVVVQSTVTKPYLASYPGMYVHALVRCIVHHCACAI